MPETRRRIDVYTPGQNRWLIIAVSWVILVLLVWGGLFFYVKSVKDQLAKADAELTRIETTRKPKEELKLLQLKSAIAGAKSVLASHVTWSPALERVQHLIQPQVQFDNLSVKLDRQSYSFKAFAANLMTVAKQIAAFNTDDAASKVEIGRISIQPNGRVEFIANLNLDLAKIIHPITTNQ